jgi:calcium/calmodulin-dependent protein kinase I
MTKSAGHSKPVDVWAMGVITYFLLAGYTPFDRDTQQEEMEAIIAGDYKFEPRTHSNLSSPSKLVMLAPLLQWNIGVMSPKPLVTL